MNVFLATYGWPLTVLLLVFAFIIVLLLQRKKKHHLVLTLRSRLKEKELLVEHFKGAEKKAREENVVQQRENLRFAAHLNRSIRMPLNSISGLTTLMCASDINEEQTAFMHGISNSVNELVVSVDEMMKSIGLNPNSGDVAMHANHEGNTNHENSALLDTNFGASYPMSILIAEDDLMNQQLATMILTRLGYKPDIANNGNEVLEMVSEKRYDLILMDVEMPQMNGLEATRMIRLCLERQPFIIAMTANTLDSDRESCLAAGMNGYVSKPMNIEELTGLMRQGFSKAA